MAIRVGINNAQFARAAALLDPVAMAIASQAAVSDTIRTGRALVARRIGEKIALPIGEIKKQIDVKRGSFRDPTGIISIRRVPVPAILFKPTQTRRGVTVRMWKGGKRELLRGAFLHTVGAKTGGKTSTARKLKVSRGGRDIVAERKGTQGNRVPRTPLVQRYGPAVITGVTGNKGHRGAQEAITVDLSETLTKNMASQIDRFLRNPESFLKLRAAAKKAVYGTFDSLVA